MILYFIMPKSLRYYKKNRKPKRKSRKVIRRRGVKGGDGEKVKCSMCEKMVLLENTLIPRECLMKYGKAAHRICSKCWWDSEKGFALESSSHLCPGCQKDLPLTPYKKESQIFVDLTEE